MRRLKIERFRCCIEAARHAVSVTHFHYFSWFFQSSLIRMSIQVRGTTALVVCVCVCADSRAPSFFLSLHVLLVKDIHLISVDRFFQSIFAIQAAAARGGGFSGRERQAFSVRLSSLKERGRDRAPGGKGRNLISARRNCLEGKCPLSHTQHRNDKKNVESHTHTLTTHLGGEFLLYLYIFVSVLSELKVERRKWIKVRKGKILS